MLLCVQSVSAREANVNVNRSLENVFGSRDLSVLSNPDTVKLRIQTDYALTMGQQIISYLTVYELKHQAPVSYDAFYAFADALLIDDPFVAYVEYWPQVTLSVVLQESTQIVPQLHGMVLTYQYQNGIWRLIRDGEETLKNSGDDSGGRIEEPVINESDTSLPTATATPNEREPQEDGSGTGNTFVIDDADADVETPPQSGLPEELTMSSDANNTTLMGVTTPYHLDVLYAYGIITHHCQKPIHYQTEDGKWFDDEWCPAWLESIMSP